MPIIDTSELVERFESSYTRFRTDRTEINQIVLEPLFFNYTPVLTRQEGRGQVPDFHQENQNPINLNRDLSAGDIKKIVSSLYQSGMFGGNKQYGKRTQRPITVFPVSPGVVMPGVESLSNGELTTILTKRVVPQFEEMFRESVKNFSQELGITLITENIPVPTSTVGDIIKSSEPKNFLNELTISANLKQQKLFFVDKIVDRITNSLSSENSELAEPLIEKVSKLMESLMTTDHDRYYTNGDVKSETEFLHSLKQIVTLDMNTPAGEPILTTTDDTSTYPMVLAARSLPAQIRAYAEHGTEPAGGGYTDRRMFAPQSRIVYDSFKVVKMLHNLNIGDNLHTATDMEDFVSVSETSLIQSAANNDFVLITLEQYTNEDLDIGFSEISKVPVATKYVLLRDGPV